MLLSFFEYSQLSILFSTNIIIYGAAFLIPIFWRYLLKSYFKVFFLSIFSFISVLLVTKLKDIARFAALSGKFFDVCLYILYQLPSILPFAIPISCLISAILLFERLSDTFELTALRTAGLSLKKIITPLLFSGFLLFLINLYIVLEISPRCRLKSKHILYEQTSANPLLILQKRCLCPLKNSYIDFNQTKKNNQLQNLYFITINPNTKRLNFFFTKDTSLKNDILQCLNSYFLTHIPSHGQFDMTILENDFSIKTKAQALTQSMQMEKQTKYANANVPFRYLISDIKNNTSSIITEIIRRLAIGFSAFTLTYLGLAYGFEISRNKKALSRAILPTFFTIIVFSGFSLGKALHNHLLWSSAFFICPQLIFIIFAKLSLTKKSRGIE